MVGVVCDNQRDDIWILYVNVGRSVFFFRCFNSIIDEPFRIEAGCQE